MYIMVLDDGETYSGLYGCRIIFIPDAYDAGKIEEILEDIRRSNADLRQKHVVTEFK